MKQIVAGRLEAVSRVYLGECLVFSSRRRHTIFDCDWSSDVCSSDLAAEADAEEDFAWDDDESEALKQARRDAELTASADSVRAYLKQIGKVPRSEERRVGKECRSQWSLHP